MEADALFWNKIAKKYALKPVPNESVYQRKPALTQEYLEPHMQVLEIGCGTGTTALHHASMVNHITAIDFSQNMIDIAKTKAKERSITNVDFQCQSIDNLHYENDMFDMIMAHSVLHLVPNKASVLIKTFHWLKPGGVLVTSTVCISDFFRLFKYIWPLGYKLKVLPFVKSFTKQELIADHEETGFEIVHQWQPSKRDIFLIAQKPS